MHVNSVTTRQYTDALSRVEQILKAHRTVVVHCFFHARVAILQEDRVATSTFITVEEIILAVGSANTTSITVVLLS